MKREIEKEKKKKHYTHGSRSFSRACYYQGRFLAISNDVIVCRDKECRR